MKSSEVRKHFLEFFKKNGHTIIPSASLVPENDPTVLFNTAGMQPLVPYLLGQKHPQGERLANIQKCVRTVDIDDIGDNTHATFFEMMGNWSLGNYFKQEAISFSFALLTKEFGLDPHRLYVTCYKGDSTAPKDEISANIWQKLFDEHGVKGTHLYFLGADANWWPAVKKNNDSWTGPTGPCTEMFYDLTGELNKGMTEAEFLEADEKQHVVEIWNDVFMEYIKTDGKITGKLEKRNVDTGSGFERMCAVLQGKNNIFETDIFVPIMSVSSSLTSDVRKQRIISDHIRTSIFMIADGVLPSNTDQGYILRRLIRRAVFNTDTRRLDAETITAFVTTVSGIYKDAYPEIQKQSTYIMQTISDESSKFEKTLEHGLKEFEKISTENISGEHAFTLFSSYGFPIELTKELAKTKGVSVDVKGYDEEFKKHQHISRSGSEGKFKGGLGDTSEMSLKYHTATHLLHQALHDVLGNHISQKGSNITAERLRFDFSHGAKMTDEEKKKVEDIINEKIKENLPVHKVELPKEEALRLGAKHFFNEKYGDTVSVYYIGNDIHTAYSKEFCGGPHVTNTGVLGTFKIQKEEAVAAGVRRIKAVLS